VTRLSAAITISLSVRITASEVAAAAPAAIIKATSMRLRRFIRLIVTENPCNGEVRGTLWKSFQAEAISLVWAALP
jgi:hypothetical protein